MVSTVDGVTTSGRIVEAEAYLGENDSAAHSARGPTPRTAIQWGHAGYGYVYLIYGIYSCFNIVTEVEGRAGCVLIRALEPLTGLNLMQLRRSRSEADVDLCNGPGKLTQALGINTSHCGTDLTKPPIFLTDAHPVEDHRIKKSSRIGVRTATNLLYRFFIRDSHYVSPVKVSGHQ